MSDKIKYVDLPDDMRVLVSRYTQISDDCMPEYLPLKIVNVADLPVIPLDEYDRGTLYARKMNTLRTPPIIIANNHFLDGKHRRQAFQERGLETIRAIDLSELANPGMVIANSMGEIGKGVRYDSLEMYPDSPQYLVWDYDRQAFIGNGKPTPFADEAEELSRRDIDARYDDPRQYLIFLPHDVDEKRQELQIRKHGKLWCWRFSSPGDRSSEGWIEGESKEQCLRASEGLALRLLMNRRDPDPFPLCATKNPVILSAADFKRQSRSARHQEESIFEW